MINADSRNCSGHFMKNIRISLAQFNPTVGDINGNIRKMCAMIRRARKIGSDIVAFPELAVTGYPPEDLILKPHFILESRAGLQKIIDLSEGITVITGFVDSNGGIYNAAAVICGQRVADIYHKIHLPNYGVFDEYRYFKKGNRYPVYDLGGVRFGVNICEDIWHEKTPMKVQAEAGADFIVNINASPYHMGKVLHREEHVSALARQCGAGVLYVNMTGGQDELVFDGGSFAVDAGGDIVARANQFREEMLTVDLAVGMGHGKQTSSPSVRKGRGRNMIEHISLNTALHKDLPGFRNRKCVGLSESGEVYNALVMGTRDYVVKNGFSSVVIGLSGGIDSALVAAIAVDALGSDRVHGIFMPSVYTSQASREDVAKLAENLGIRVLNIPVDTVLQSYMSALKRDFQGTQPDITEENLQARIRGNFLMAFSNKFGWMVLTTGNKSEMSVGYATLYGDMAGGFAVIKDVPKMLVYNVSEWRNSQAGHDIIPERILVKEPSAELRPDQKDTDSLPPYPILDPILKSYVEDNRSLEKILDMGCDEDCTKRIIAMVDRAEYKRRQAPPGIKITPRAFGKDRRMPITNGYRRF